MSTEQERQRLREVAGAATPGPWEATIWDLHPEQRRLTSAVATPSDVLICDTKPDTDCTNYAANADFIATFDPPTVLALLDELAAVERERDEAMASEESIRLARYRVGREHRCPTCEHCEVMIHAEDQRDAALARAEAAEGVVARVRELVDQADAGEGIVIYPGHGEYHCVETGLLRAALSDPTPGMDPTSGDGANGAPGRQSASPGGTSGANDAGGIQAAVESIKRQAGDWTLDPDGGAGAPHRNERVTVVPAWEEA